TLFRGTFFRGGSETALGGMANRRDARVPSSRIHAKGRKPQRRREAPGEQTAGLATAPKGSPVSPKFVVSRRGSAHHVELLYGHLTKKAVRRARRALGFDLAAPSAATATRTRTRRRGCRRPAAPASCAATSSRSGKVRSSPRRTASRLPRT